MAQAHVMVVVKPSRDIMYSLRMVQKWTTCASRLQWWPRRSASPCSWLQPRPSCSAAEQVDGIARSGKERHRRSHIAIFPALWPLCRTRHSRGDWSRPRWTAFSVDPLAASGVRDSWAPCDSLLFHFTCLFVLPGAIKNNVLMWPPTSTRRRCGTRLQKDIQGQINQLIFFTAEYSGTRRQPWFYSSSWVCSCI